MTKGWKFLKMEIWELKSKAKENEILAGVLNRKFEVTEESVKLKIY